jgi:hypothetical protein
MKRRTQKFPSRSGGRRFTLRAILMTKPLFLLSLAACLVCTSGCGMFSKKGRVKENPAIASEVEETFRRRWVDKRVAELTAQGTAAEAARQQADTEFREKYGFTPAGKR